jgi:16S rRNA (cytosine967-C5)-methyltransferase
MQREKVLDPLLDRVLKDPQRIADDLPDAVWPTDSSERLAAELCLPPWLASRLEVERGEDAARKLAAAFRENACVDLRVQTARCSRGEALRRLESETGMSPVPTPWSPRGLRLAKRLNLGSSGAYRDGWVEVADEGTQLVALALEPAEGSTVVDACAGAGGKTLALADLLLAPEGTPGNSSRAAPRLLACDISSSRLDKLMRRALRAGVHHHVGIIPLPESGAFPTDLPRADLVLIDAPCSGLGTLRRNPELKMRHGPPDIDRFQGAQLHLLERWAPLVRPGGRLAYVTCSILRAENEEVAGSFSARHPEFTLCTSRWAKEHLPAGCLRGGHLHLDPVIPGTDGFFLAQWRRR